MDKYIAMLHKEKFDILKLNLKFEIEEEPDNFDFWYLLFLAENNNYIDFDEDEVNNIEAFNKALELAKDYQKTILLSEFDLFSQLRELEGFDYIIRTCQLQRKKSCLKALKKYTNFVKCECESDKIADDLKILFANPINPIQFNLQLLIVNALYFKTRNKKFVDLFNELNKGELKYYSKLNMPYIINSYDGFMDVLDPKYVFELNDPNFMDSPKLLNEKLDSSKNTTYFFYRQSLFGRFFKK